MRPKGLGQVALLAAAGACLAPSVASAQVDVRLIRPNVVILLDTSGSMEWRTNSLNDSCSGVDGGSCNQCSNGVSLCSSACPESERRNRWTTALEVLTGTISNFSCAEVARTDTSWYDWGYLIPYHEPRSNGVPLWDSRAVQAGDGILDTYSNRVRFGLMTFDNELATGTSATNGMFSYGPDRPWRLNATCSIENVNVGARRPSVDNDTVDIVPGGLRSVGDPAADSATLTAINEGIQRTIAGRPASGSLPAVAGIRPYGGTPIAGILDDAYHYWRTHRDVVEGAAGVGDPYFRCRTRANILITDGLPNLDMRPACTGGMCPYNTADQISMSMAMSGPGQPNARTYVIGFNATDTGAASALTPIAVAGGSGRVYYANDRPTLAAALSTVLDTVTSASSTRTAPVFAQAGSASLVTADGTAQYQFQSSFNVSPGLPWGGELRRTRTECVRPSPTAPPAPVAQPFDATRGDDFSYNLQTTQRSGRGWGQRYLWTFLPTGAASTADMTRTIVNPTTSTTGAVAPLDPGSTTVPYGLFNVSSSGARDTLLSWLRGDTGTVRASRPLGDIYHSNPIVVPPPTVSLPDQTFTTFRQRVLSSSGPRNTRTSAVTVGTREPMMYVGTNDGVLHAFNVDSGEEVWGFVPPFLIPTLQAAYPNVRQFGVDGTPVAREVRYERSAATLGNADNWRTVLVVGLRQGGGAYVALDVTDPYAPRFLWQFTDASLREAYGTPAIGTVFMTPPGGGAPVERAVAFLPGGTGVASPSATCSSGANTRPTRNPMLTGYTGGRGAQRASIRCWQGSYGQNLYVVDLETGALVRRFGSLGSPIVGSPGLYNGVSGAVSTRAYVGDADGGLWRVDLTDPEPSRWTMSLQYDLFWDRSHLEGQPVVERPVITLDSNNDVLVAFGSGDPDLLEGTEANRIASFRESVARDAGGTPTAIRTESVWELRVGPSALTDGLYTGERLTGPLTLFNNVLYFGTFVPQTSSDACQYGFSRLWGVDLGQADPSTPFIPRARLDLDGDPVTTTDIVRVTRDLNGDGSDADDVNAVLFGVTVNREVSCASSSTTFDPFTGTSRTVTTPSGPSEYRLVIQTTSSAAGSARNVVVRQRRLPPPIIPARVDAWATVFE